MGRAYGVRAQTVALVDQIEAAFFAALERNSLQRASGLMASAFGSSGASVEVNRVYDSDDSPAPISMLEAWVPMMSRRIGPNEMKGTWLGLDIWEFGHYREAEIYSIEEGISLSGHGQRLVKRTIDQLLLNDRNVRY